MIDHCGDANKKGPETPAPAAPAPVVLDLRDPAAYRRFMGGPLLDAIARIERQPEPEAP